MFSFASITQEKVFFKLLENNTIDIYDLFEVSNIPIQNIFEIAIKYNNVILLEHIKKMDLLTLNNLSSLLSETPVMMLINYNNILMYDSVLKLFPYRIERIFEKAIEKNSNTYINFLIDKIEPNDITVGILMKVLKKKDNKINQIEKLIRKLELNEKIQNIKTNYDISNYVVKNNMLYILNLLIELKYSFDTKILATAIETNDVIVVENILKKVVSGNATIYEYIFDVSMIDPDILTVLKTYGYNIK